MRERDRGGVVVTTFAKENIVFFVVVQIIDSTVNVATFGEFPTNKQKKKEKEIAINLDPGIQGEIDVRKKRELS